MVIGSGVTDMSSSTPNLRTGEGKPSADVLGSSPMLFNLSSLVSKSPWSSRRPWGSVPLTTVAGTVDLWFGSTTEYGGGLEVCPGIE